MDAAVWEVLRPGEPGARGRLEELLAGDGGRAHLRRVEARHGRGAARFVSLQRELMARARARFPDGRVAVATAKGLEQASAARVADARARRFAAAARDLAGAVAWDACCGIGSDALALARAGVPVVASELDPRAARCAAFHLATDPAVAAATAVVLLDAARHAPPADERGRVLGLFDPDRRRDGRRLGDPRDWSPPLARVLEAARALAGACLKLPPGLDPAATGLPEDDDVLLEWTSLDGELKELTRWSGRLGRALDGAAPRRARALTSGGRRETFEGEAHGRPPAEEELFPGRWLVELDPALDRSGLAAAYGAEHGLAPAAGGGGYWVAEDARAGALARPWPVLEVLPMDRKRVRAALRARGIGRPTVKTRGIREPAETIAARIDGGGEAAGLVAVTTGPRGRIAVLLGPPPAPPGQPA